MTLTAIATLTVFALAGVSVPVLLGKTYKGPRYINDAATMRRYKKMFKA